MNRGKVAYLIREGFRNIWVNRLMSVASVSVLVSCLIMVGIAFMILMNAQELIERIEDENVMMVFIEDNASEETIAGLKNDIESLGNVEKCEFVSKEGAFEKQIEELGSLGNLFEGMPANPLPDAFRVTVSDLNNFKATHDDIEALENVLEITDNRELAEKILAIRSTVLYVSSGVILLLLVVSLFIVSNTIKITMFSRRLEISIMKSVGATNWFIRWPFMIEGTILGIFAGIFSLLILWGIYQLAVNSLGLNASQDSMFAGFSAIQFKDYYLMILVGFLAVGISAGAFGSIFTIRKYLKEKELDYVPEKENI